MYPTALFALFGILDKFSWISTYHGVRSDVFGDNCTGGYHSAFTDGYTWANHDTAANPYTFFDHNRLAAHDIMISKVMVCGHNRYMRRNHDIILDSDASR